MTPIKNLSEVRRLPRLDKIRLGIKVEGAEGVSYPRAVDYFVCPPDVQAVFGEKPKELRIMFPVEDDTLFAQQWYRCYRRTRGLVCKGDGETADGSFDKATGALATKDTKEVIRREVLCAGQGCPEFQRRACRRLLNLQFLLPEVPGLGVWQLDTSSINSILNINNAVELIRAVCGRVRMVPLVLSVKMELHGPAGGQQMPVPVLHLNSTATLAEIQQAAALPPTRALLPAPEPPEEEPAPDDLYPTEVLDKAEAAAAAQAPSPPPESPFQPPTAEAAQPPRAPDEELFPSDPREVIRQQVVHLLTKGPTPNINQIAKWWDDKGWGYRLLPSDMAKPFTGGEVLLAHLVAFRNDLVVYQQKARASQKTEETK